MKAYKRTAVITTILMLLPMVIGLLLWNQLPERVPTHWNAAGEIDGWSGRAMAVFGIPGIMLGCHLLCALATLTDPKRTNVGKVIHFVLWLMPVLALVVSGAMYATALGKQLNVSLIIGVLVGLTFVITGNYLPKCKQNYTVGIKLPWTLNSEENWNRTHRMAGWLWMLCGVVTIVGALVSPEGFFVVILAATVVMVFAPGIYSFVLYKKGI